MLWFAGVVILSLMRLMDSLLLAYSAIVHHLISIIFK